MKIKTTYQIVTHESAAIGDCAESGWIDEDGVPFASVQDAAEFLIDNGARYPSSTMFHKGLWYSGDPDTDYRTGAEETHSFHLYDFTPDQEKEVYRRVVGED